MDLINPNKFMKKVFLTLLVVLLIISVGINVYLFSKGRLNLGDSSNPRLVTLMGEDGDAERMLPAYLMENSSSTDPASFVDGGTITQKVVTTGVNTVRLFYTAIGSVSSSTVDTKLMGSFNGADYYEMMYNTSTPNYAGNGTTTPTISPYATSFVPGTASTSWSYDYNVTGTNYVRFLMKSNNAGDLNDGAQAYIQAIVLDEF